MNRNPRPKVSAKKPSPKAVAKAKAANKKPLPDLIPKDAPKRPAPEGTDTPPVPESILHMKYMLGALMTLAGCLNDLATVVAQGVRDENAAKRGNIAAGLERAAAYVLLKPFEIKAPEGAPKEGTKP